MIWDLGFSERAGVSVPEEGNSSGETVQRLTWTDIYCLCCEETGKQNTVSTKWSPLTPALYKSGLNCSPEQGTDTGVLRCWPRNAVEHIQLGQRN